MSEEELIKSWNMGLTVNQVAKEYMKVHNKEAGKKRDIEKITNKQALEHVEPILFKYRLKQLKGANK